MTRSVLFLLIFFTVQCVSAAPLSELNQYDGKSGYIASGIADDLGCVIAEEKRRVFRVVERDELSLGMSLYRGRVLSSPKRSLKKWRARLRTEISPSSRELRKIRRKIRFLRVARKVLRHCRTLDLGEMILPPGGPLREGPESPLSPTPTETITPTPTATPTPPPSPPGPNQLKNPYHQEPKWRMVADDNSPYLWREFALNVHPPEELGPKTYFYPNSDEVTYPDLERFMNSSGKQDFLGKVSREDASPLVSGWHDEVLASIDAGHSVAGTTFENLSIAENFLLLPAIGSIRHSTPLTYQVLRDFGVNFTTESYSIEGHHRIQRERDILETEEEMFFANILRTSPAFKSFKDVLNYKAIDSYDGLFSHKINSVGRSRSENNISKKMLFAGGYIPPEIKYLMKFHGAYAPAMLMMFKTALPYTDVEGVPLPAESEMRHRSAYSESGKTVSNEFASKNKFYHLYPEGRHLFNMIAEAISFQTPPPVTLLNFQTISVERDRAGLVVENATDDSRIKGNTKTNLRVWGNPGETIRVRVDLSASYDLLDAPLTYTLNPVYFNHENVDITDLGDGVFEVQVEHDPSLPKGRIPVIALAHNGTHYGNPIFLNFYWPEEGQSSFVPYLEVGQAVENPPHEVNRNARPQIAVQGGVVKDVIAGDVVTWDINCTDPNGYPTRWYRWEGDRGVYDNGTVLLETSALDKGTVIKTRFICSDGTGGYNSTELTAQVL